MKTDHYMPRVADPGRKLQRKAKRLCAETGMKLDVLVAEALRLGLERLDENLANGGCNLLARG